MKRLFIIVTTLTTAVMASVVMYAIPYLEAGYNLSSIQSFFLTLLVIICAGIIASAGFEYIFDISFENFLRKLQLTWDKNESLESLNDKDFYNEFSKILTTAKALTKKSSERIKELESKGGYSDIYYNLITTISHQLRTPITGLKWALKSMDDDASKNVPMDKSMMSDSIEAAKRISDIIEELLVGVNEEKSNNKKYEPVDIEKCLESILLESALVSKQRGIKVSIVKKSELVPLVEGITYEIKFILHSLVTNAINYSYKDKIVTVTVEHVDKFVKVTVHNFGVFIQEKEKGSIFSQFGRSQEAIKMNPNGSGLGLYLTKKIVIDHGGTIRFNSDEKNGTFFTVDLPISNRGQLETSIHF